MANPELIIGSFVNNLTRQADEWIRENTAQVEVNGETLPLIKSEAWWELLGKPKRRHSDWWNWVTKNHKLKEGNDFFDLVAKNATKSKGRPSTTHYLPKRTAIRLGAVANTDLGRAILERLVETSERVERADPELIKEMIARQKDPEFLAAIADYSLRKAAEYWLGQGKPKDWVEGWLAMRCRGIASRVTFTATLKDHGIKGNEYGKATNTVYQGLFGADASSLREESGLSGRETPRNRLETEELLEVALTEARSARRIKEQDAQGFHPCNRVIRDAAEKLAASR